MGFAVRWPARSIRRATAARRCCRTCTTRADQGKAQGGGPAGVTDRPKPPIMVALRTEHLTQRPLIAAAYSPTVRALAAMITTSNEQITALELTFRTSAR